MAMWADSWWKRMRRDFARRTSKESLVCACRVPRNAGSRTAAYLPKIVYSRLRGSARRCHVFRTRASGIAWGVIGAAIDCYETALAYAKSREQFGRPIAGFQLVQQKLVWMAQEITKAQLLAFRLTRMMEMGSARPAQISLAKRNNVWMALECARKARDILGAAGITDRYPVIRHLMNLESVSTYEGTHDIHTLVIGRDITGIDAFGG